MYSFDIGKPNKNSQSLCKIIEKDSVSHKFQFENHHQGPLDFVTIIKTNPVDSDLGTWKILTFEC